MRSFAQLIIKNYRPRVVKAFAEAMVEVFGLNGLLINLVLHSSGIGACEDIKADRRSFEIEFHFSAHGRCGENELICKSGSHSTLNCFPSRYLDLPVIIQLRIGYRLHVSELVVLLIHRIG